MTINSFQDCKRLKDDLVYFTNWCVDNCLNINLDKCTRVSFTRRKIPSIFNYPVNKNNLRSLSSIKDFGIIVSVNLSFSNNTSCIYKKAMRMLS
jgi:hypothetical protein